MFKTTITYENFNEELTTETLYFHLSVPEFMDLDLSGTEEDTETYLKRIMAEDNKKLIFKALKDLLLISYGKKSDDGRHFKKDEEERRDFENSEAFSQILITIATDEKVQTSFLSGIIPNVKKNEDTKKSIVELPDSSKQYSKDDIDNAVREAIDKFKKEV